MKKDKIRVSERKKEKGRRCLEAISSKRKRENWGVKEKLCLQLLGLSFLVVHT
jgi:hypothetical protein